MGTISITTPSDGQTIDASDVTTPLNTIVAEINGNLDSNNITDGGITSAKLAESFFRGRKQEISTNTAPTGLTVQYGWGYAQFSGSSNTDTNTVTFPAAFSSPPVVFVSSLGYISGSNPDSIDDFNVGYKVIQSPYDISTSSFTLQSAFSESSGNPPAALRVGYSWIAIGPV